MPLRGTGGRNERWLAPLVGKKCIGLLMCAAGRPWKVSGLTSRPGRVLPTSPRSSVVSRRRDFRKRQPSPQSTRPEGIGPPSCGSSPFRADDDFGKDTSRIVTSRNAIAALLVDDASWLLGHADGGGNAYSNPSVRGGKASARLTRPGSLPSANRDLGSPSQGEPRKEWVRRSRRTTRVALYRPAGGCVARAT